MTGVSQGEVYDRKRWIQKTTTSKLDQLDPQTLNNTRRKLTVQIPRRRTEGARAMYDVSLSVTESVREGYNARVSSLRLGSKSRLGRHISVMYIIITEDRSIFVGGRDWQRDRQRQKCCWPQLQYSYTAQSKICRVINPLVYISQRFSHCVTQTAGFIWHCCSVEIPSPGDAVAFNGTWPKLFTDLMPSYLTQRLSHRS